LSRACAPERFAATSLKDSRLKLEGGVRYTPDWYVETSEGATELHEVKGSRVFDNEARNKFKAASARFPYLFVWAQKIKDEWHVASRQRPSPA
jgi:hypothetical protein